MTLEFDKKLAQRLLSAAIVFAEVLDREVSLERFMNRLNGTSSSMEATQFIINSIILRPENANDGEELNDGYIKHTAHELMEEMFKYKNYIALTWERVPNKGKIIKINKAIEKYLSRTISDNYNFDNKLSVKFINQNDVKDFIKRLKKIQEEYK